MEPEPPWEPPPWEPPPDECGICLSPFRLPGVQRRNEMPARLFARFLWKKYSIGEVCFQDSQLPGPRPEHTQASPLRQGEGEVFSLCIPDPELSGIFHINFFEFPIFFLQIADLRFRA